MVEDFVTQSNEQITVRVEVDRKKQLLDLSIKTGVQTASLVRSWIFEKLDEAQSCKGGDKCR